MIRHADMVNVPVIARLPFERLFLQQRTSFTFAYAQKRFSTCLVVRNTNVRSVSSASLHHLVCHLHGESGGQRNGLAQVPVAVAGRRPLCVFSNQLSSCQSSKEIADYCKRQPSLFHYQAMHYSTRPDKKRVKNLMFATYISATIGIVLLTAVGFRFYSRFKKRARGIEELDVPQYGRRSRYLCRYRGYVLPSLLVDTIVNDIPWFEVRSDDVWVISFPKAGTTWLQEIVYLISTDYDYEKATATNIDERFPFLEFPLPGIKEVSKKDSPRFIKSHLPFSLLPKQFEEKKPKVIYLARNPKDTVVSLDAFTRLTNYVTFSGNMDDFARLFVEGTVVYGPWTKHVQEGWERRNDDNVLFVTYEDLHKDFCGTVREIAKFLGKPLSDSQLRELEHHCSFRNMQKNDRVNYSWQKGIWKEGDFMRKGKIGDWKNHLSLEMSAKLDAMATSLSPLGLDIVDS